LRTNRLTVGPTASLQYTNVYVSGFNEKGSLAPLQIHSESEEPLRSDLGLRASYQWQVRRALVVPYLTATWEHEFKYSALPITAGLAALPETHATFVGPAEGHDSALISAGASIAWAPAVSTFIGYEGELGRNRYDSHTVTGGIRFTF
jgi:outer membrane autotransporter protein